MTTTTTLTAPVLDLVPSLSAALAEWVSAMEAATEGHRFDPPHVQQSARSTLSVYTDNVLILTSRLEEALLAAEAKAVSEG